MSAGAGLAGGGSTGAMAHWVQARKARVLPALPSHVEALTGPPDEAVRFFAAVHDLAMGVTEAWNAGRARARGGRVEELINRDALRAAHRGVVDGDEALRTLLASEADRAAEASRADDALAGSWTYTSNDNYRTETYTVTVTDSKGKTRTETRTRQVYVNTDHYFTFHRDSAVRAQQLVRAWLVACQGTRWTTLGVRNRRVSVDRISVAERSLLERLVKGTIFEDPEAVVSAEDLERLCNQWLLGTRIDEELAAMPLGFRRMEAEQALRFQALLASPPSAHYRTTSRVHPGPGGYQACQALRVHTRAVWGAWASVDGMLRTCRSSADDLLAWAEDPETVESDRTYADAAVAAYKAAFPNSEIEIDQLPSHGWTVGVGVGMGLLSAVGSFLAHPAGFGLFG